MGETIRARVDWRPGSWRPADGFNVSHQLIYRAIKQYSGNKVREGRAADQSTSLFCSPGYGKIDLSNKAFAERSMDWFAIHQPPLSILFNIGFSSQGKCIVLNTAREDFWSLCSCFRKCRSRLKEKKKKKKRPSL